MTHFKYKFFDIPNVNYVIKPEHGIVAKEETVHPEILNFNKDWKDDIVFVAQFYLPEYPEKMKVVAKCADGDEWNEDTGVKLVDQKMFLKKHKKYAKQAERMARMFQELAVDMQEIAVKHNAKADLIEKDINEYFRGKVD